MDLENKEDDDVVVVIDVVIDVDDDVKEGVAIGVDHNVIRLTMKVA